MAETNDARECAQTQNERVTAACTAVNAIEQKLVDELAPIEAKLSDDDVRFLRFRIAGALVAVIAALVGYPEQPKVD